MQSDIFGRRISGFEVGQVVEISVMHRIDHLIQPPFQVMKIHHHADLVELRCGDGDFDLPVMPMQRLERAVIKPKLMRGGEVAGGGDLKWHLLNHTENGEVEQHSLGATMMAMSIVSNHPELKDREEPAVYLPKRMTEEEFVDWCDDETWAEWIDGRV